MVEVLRYAICIVISGLDVQLLVEEFGLVPVAAVGLVIAAFAAYVTFCYREKKAARRPPRPAYQASLGWE